MAGRRIFLAFYDFYGFSGFIKKQLFWRVFDVFFDKNCSQLADVFLTKKHEKS